MLTLIQKIMGIVATKVAPYWCPYCPKRFITEKSFQNHYLLCEGRLMAKEKERRALESLAPVNREQRRRMAKRAGQIKDWRKLND